MLMSVTKVLLVLVMVNTLVVSYVNTSEMQEQAVEKRAQAKKPIVPSQKDIITVLSDLLKRVNRLETKQTILLRGRDGRDGKPGVPGVRGPEGQTGQRGPPGPKSSGVQYVRWGRTTCSSDAILVYKGRVGGEHFIHRGGGTNYVCLPETPKYGRYKPGNQGGGYMYGTEYQVNSFNPFTTKRIHDHEAPCAVCYVETRSAKLMIPATYECPAGWVKEYQGYLMTESFVHNHSREIICVDQDAEYVSGTHANLDGALLYTVEGVCGSLPCLPYVSGRALTCAVCTK